MDFIPSFKFKQIIFLSFLLPHMSFCIFLDSSIMLKQIQIETNAEKSSTSKLCETQMLSSIGPK